jgi:rhodanese-related sulfurtransferase
VGSSQVVPIVDVPVEEVWARFEADPTSLLADVGTAAECAFVGLPDPSSLDKQPPLAEWQAFPGNRLDPQFEERLSEMLNAPGVEQDAELFLNCGSGGRSKMAAQVMALSGFT